MTVTYSAEVANCSSFGCFWKILLKWKGSVYKLIWKELLAYIMLYITINLTYNLALTNSQRETFRKFQSHFASQTESIPMSFVLGFYVTLIVKRWWEQYRLLPWPDSLALFVSAAIPGVDDRGRMMRRNIMRYSMLSYVITLQQVSFRVKKRFPTWQHLVDAGLMMECEKKIFEKMDGKAEMSKYWMPLVWATNIINRARKETLILNDQVVQTILRELSDIRKSLGSLIGYDTVCVPLVYTQVVTLSVYTYFLASLLGRQIIAPETEELHRNSTALQEKDFFWYFSGFPLFTVLQFCFYIGWLKVAEVLINPFGEDDDDIELNWLIDRHLKAAYMIVDEMHEENIELLKDKYWEEVVPKDLPYTVASEHYRRQEPKGSAQNFVVTEADGLYANLKHNVKTFPAEDVYADYVSNYESVDTPLVERRKNWFQRQMSRMSSVRSASTTYSSGGLFGRTRHNSVYSSPESGMPIGIPGPQHLHSHKVSLYDRLVGRKSGRGHSRRQGTPKMNGAGIPISLKNRPRIPTPDVTKEVVDRENRLANMHLSSGVLHSGLTTGTFVAHQLNSASPHHHHQQSYSTDLPVVQVVLSPIQELDSPPGHHGHPGSPKLNSPMNGTVFTTMTLTPVTMTRPMLTSLALTDTMSLPLNSLHNAVHFQQSRQPNSPATIMEVGSSSEDDGGTSSSTASIEGDRSRKASVASQTKRGEVYV